MNAIPPTPLKPALIGAAIAATLASTPAFAFGFCDEDTTGCPCDSRQVTAAGHILSKEGADVVLGLAPCEAVVMDLTATPDSTSLGSAISYGFLNPAGGRLYQKNEAIYGTEVFTHRAWGMLEETCHAEGSFFSSSVFAFSYDATYTITPRRSPTGRPYNSAGSTLEAGELLALPTTVSGSQCQDGRHTYDFDLGVGETLTVTGAFTGAENVGVAVNVRLYDSVQAQVATLGNLAAYGETPFDRTWTNETGQAGRFTLEVYTDVWTLHDYELTLSGDPVATPTTSAAPTPSATPSATSEPQATPTTGTPPIATPNPSTETPAPTPPATQPAATATPAPSPEPSAPPTATPLVTPELATASPTSTSTVTQTNAPTDAPTDTPTVSTVSATPTGAPTTTPSPTAEGTDVPSPTTSPTPTDTENELPQSCGTCTGAEPAAVLPLLPFIWLRRRSKRRGR